jgi:hypothetical protein
MWFRKSRPKPKEAIMPSTLQDQTIIPAMPGTVLLRFNFFMSIKASVDQVQQKTIRRPVLCWRLVGDRPMPIAAGLPIVDDPENTDRCEAVLIHGVGMIIDPLTGMVWGADELWIKHVTGIWSVWLKEQKASSPPVVAAPPPSLPAAILGAHGTSGFMIGERVHTDA